MGSPIDLTHQPTQLTTDECWSIIKSRVYPNSSDMSHELKNIGGTMRKDMTKEAWSSIQQSPIWNSLGSNNDSVVHVLRLSYDRLKSPSLKKCFSYCSIFPDDTVLKREQLIQLWAAADFLHPSRADHCQTKWDLGNRYFNDLLSNSLFQDVERDKYGDVKACKMHDSVHSLARSLSETTILSSDNDPSVDITRIHHVNVSGRDSDDKIATLKDTDEWNMRSLFTKFDALLFVKKFRRLRILSFVDAIIDELANSIGKLKLLQYFDISGTKIKALPDSFTKLYNLETFKVERCWKLKKLPERMSNLVELSHLYFDEREELVPINIGRLTCLQTLQFFVVGVQKGCGIAELGGLGQLQGRLEIRKLQFVRNKEEAMAAKLDDKKKIRELVLRWNDGKAEETDGEVDEETMKVEQHELVLDGVKPHTNLKGLEIRGYSGDYFPSWFSTIDRKPQTLLANLLRLELVNCANCVRLPSLGHLDNLTYLGISALPKVKSIGTEFYSDGNFPALKTFKLYHMESLEEWDWTTKLDAFRSLEKFELENCKELRCIGDGLSTCTRLKELIIRDYGELKVISLMNGLPNLEKLELVNCKELRCIGDGLSTCTQLKELSIRDCGKLKVIPLMNGLPSLVKLELLKCKELRCIGDDLSTCTQLKELSIRNCGKLKGISLMNGLPSLGKLKLVNYKKLRCIGDGLSTCTRLKELIIRRCDDLKFLPSLHRLSSLETFKCSKLTSGLECLPYLTSLVDLSISNCPRTLWDGIPELSWSCLTAIKKLVIFELDELEALPKGLDSLTSLEYLGIWDCPNLKSLEALPSSLKELTLSDGGSEREEMPPYFDFRHQYIPTSLEILSLQGLKKWKTLPPQIQHLTTLKQLHIGGFGIEALPEWLGNLSSIQIL